MELVAPSDYRNITKPVNYNDYARAQQEFELKKAAAIAQAQNQRAALDIQREALKAKQAPQFKVVGNQIVRLDENTGMVQPVYSAPNAISPYQQFMMEDRGAKVQERKDKEIDTQAEKYSKTLESTGLADLIGAAERANNAVAGTGDIAGYGAAVGALPDWAVSKEGVATRQEIANLQNSILKARSGGAVTPQEADRFMTELGAGLGRGDQNLRTGVANITATLKDKLKNAQAGYSPEAIQRYEGRGGIAGGRLSSQGQWKIEAVE